MNDVQAIGIAESHCKFCGILWTISASLPSVTPKTKSVSSRLVSSLVSTFENKKLESLTLRNDYYLYDYPHHHLVALIHHRRLHDLFVWFFVLLERLDLMPLFVVRRIWVRRPLCHQEWSVSNKLIGTGERKDSPRFDAGIQSLGQHKIFSLGRKRRHLRAITRLYT